MDTREVRLPQIARYRVESVIGSGGMATVFLAVQESLSRQVALKVMNDGLCHDPEFRKRFVKEGRLIAQLTHPNIVTVYDIGVSDETHYLSMTYLPGGTLKERIRSGAALPNALAILSNLASALSYAHRHGIVHRDIKPSNVLFTASGIAVLADFGIAKSIGEETQLTSAGLTLGSVHYMSPEQFQGDAVDSRSDLYSLGVVFWQMLTGDLPYRGDDAIAVAVMHTRAPIPQLPKELRQFQPLVNRLLAKRPDQRFGSADEVIRLIEAIPERQRTILTPASGTSTAQSQPTLKQRTLSPATLEHASIPRAAPPSPSKGRSRAILASALIGLLGGGGYLAFGLVSPHGTPLFARLTGGEGPAVAMAVKTSTPAGDAAELRARAEQRWREGKVVAPPGDNAFELYTQLLALEPDDADVKQRLVAIGRTEVVEKLLRRADRKLREGAIDDAQQIIEAGLKISPGDERLLGLARALR